MSEVAGGPPDGARERATPADVRSVRRLMLIAGFTYLAWWFVVEAVLPSSFNPLAGRLAVVSLFFAGFAASFASEAAKRHAARVFAVCAWLLTLHYYYLLHGNHGDMPWAVGAYVVVVAVSACLPTRRSLWAYSLLTIALGVGVSLLDRALLQSIFLPGLATMIALSNLTLHNRLLFEQERVERARVEAQRAAAQRDVALRDEFIAVASHELRTPLAALQLAVQGLARAARREESAPSAETVADALDICQRQTVRLARLVSGLLDASQVASDRIALQLESVSLLEIAREVAGTFAFESARRGCAIEVAGDPDARGSWDRLRVEQVVANLVQNAITFGSGQPVRIDVSAMEEGAARLSVTDRGIGIAPEDQARIFGRFERAVPSKNYGGMGLGLYVVAKIVEAHRGRVTVESQPGQGARFVVELPRASE